MGYLISPQLPSNYFPLKVLHQLHHVEMHIPRREIGKREIGNREISRGKLGTGKSGKYREKLHIFRAKMTQKRLKIMPKILPKYANFNMYD